MVRLMLVLAPVMCILSGIAASSLLSLHVKDIEPKVEKHHEKKKKHDNNLMFRSEVNIVITRVPMLCSIFRMQFSAKVRLRSQAVIKMIVV